MAFDYSVATFLRPPMLCLMLLMNITVMPFDALANSGKNPVILARTIAAESLPLPGQPLELIFKVTSAGDVQTDIRVFANLDGKFSEFFIKRGYLNAEDVPEYIVKAISPQRFLNYTVLVPRPDLPPLTRSFTIQRKCLRNTPIANLDIKLNSTNAGERVTSLVLYSKRLDEQLQMQARTIELLEKLTEELGRKQ